MIKPKQMNRLIDDTEPIPMPPLSSTNSHPIDYGLERWVSPKIAAKLTGLSVSTLAKRRLKGDAPCFVKISKSVRYDVRVLEAWMRDATVRSTSEFSSR